MPFSHAQATGSVNPILSNIVQHYSLDQFSWFENAAAPELVNNGALSGQVPAFNTDAIRKVSTLHVVGENPVEIDPAKSFYQAYDLEAHSLMFKESTTENNRMKQGGWDPNDVLISRTEELKLGLAIARHYALYAALTTSANYQTGLYSAATLAWSNDNADIPEQVRVKVQAIDDLRGIAPNVMIVNKKTWRYLRKHPSLLSRLPNNKLNLVSKEEAEMLLDIKIHVTDARYETAKPEGASSVSYIWGSVAWFGFVNEFASEKNPYAFTSLRTIVNSSMKNLLIESSEPDFKKDPTPGGAVIDHILKGGYYDHKFVAIDNATDKKSISAGALSGIY